ncbi:Hypothetical protein R9X50_00777900 [Acrodontium crateriforme]|uniref:L-type lectin-like domain-containing protein n=1 Tax=Acrodontium crateriforme TaxID=150365 RepID=A0AAQ3MBY6_9PEZI|nr:Hypothetical protein R9X50_00777900 [Acrodontium crateriforme]
MLRTVSLAGLAVLASTVTANYFTDKHSFGLYTPISQDNRNIPEWQANGEGHNIQVLSDRVILTPPYPGNTRGSLWGDAMADTPEWAAELEFRASGQDGGSGSLQVWYVADKKAVGLNSVNTVHHFDGLAIVVDQYGHTGGKVRAFLNDGTKDFSRERIDSLVFGSCDFAYRNRGWPSRIKITHQDGLKVTVDDRDCFQTDRVQLPKTNYFGITGTTGDNPDSFEVTKFIVTTPEPHHHYNTPTSGQGVPNMDNMKSNIMPGSPAMQPDHDADEFKTQSAQFEDLHNRLQGMQHSLLTIFGELNTISGKVDHQKDNMPRNNDDLMNRINSRVESMERMLVMMESRDYERKLNNMQRSVDDLKRSLDSIKGGLAGELHEKLGHVITSAAPRMGTFVGVIVAVQILLAIAYVVYKRRINSMPKKYL